jgi:hypothetical protein
VAGILRASAIDPISRDERKILSNPGFRIPQRNSEEIFSLLYELSSLSRRTRNLDEGDISRATRARGSSPRQNSHRKFCAFYVRPALESTLVCVDLYVVDPAPSSSNRDLEDRLINGRPVEDARVINCESQAIARLELGADAAIFGFS